MTSYFYHSNDSFAQNIKISRNVKRLLIIWVQNDQVSYELVYSTVAVYDKWQTNPLNLIYFISIYIRKYQVTFKEMKHFDIHK